MDALLEFVLTIIDNLTGNKLDYGIGKLVRRLTEHIVNPKLRKMLQFLLWILLFVMTVGVFTVVILRIEVLKNGKI